MAAIRTWVIAAGLLGALRAGAQDPPPAPAIVTTLPHPAQIAGADWPVAPDSPLPEVLSPAAGAACLPRAHPPGLFAAVELGLIFPNVNHDLNALVPVDGWWRYHSRVNLPPATLELTVSPEVTLGYNLANNLGSLFASYRNVTSEGSVLYRDLDGVGDARVRSRLDLNILDLAYATWNMPLGALWETRWEVGARLASIYFDSQAQGDWTGQLQSNHFLGAGPMIALNLTRHIPDCRLALFTRADFADLLGSVQQRYSETLYLGDQPLGFGSAERHGSQAVPVLGLQAGLLWNGHPDGRFQLACGYRFEQYWAVGTLLGTHGEIQTQGIFFRVAYNY